MVSGGTQYQQRAAELNDIIRQALAQENKMHATTTKLIQAAGQHLRPLATDVHVRRAMCIALLPLALTLIATLASSQDQPVESTTQAQAIILIATPTLPAPNPRQYVRSSATGIWAVSQSRWWRARSPVSLGRPKMAGDS